MPAIAAWKSLRGAETGNVTPAFWMHPAGVLEVVSVPITLGLDRPEILGTLSIGYLLNAQRAAQFKALTGAVLVLLAVAVALRALWAFREERR